jgi:hypothetical protein
LGFLDEMGKRFDGALGGEDQAAVLGGFGGADEAVLEGMADVGKAGGEELVFEHGDEDGLERGAGGRRGEEILVGVGGGGFGFEEEDGDFGLGGCHGDHVRECWYYEVGDESYYSVIIS